MTRDISLTDLGIFYDCFIRYISLNTLFGLNIFISNQFIQYNTFFNHTNIRIRTEARAYQVLLLKNTLFSAILASYEVKLLEDVDNCHLRAQLNDRNNKYNLFNTKFKSD